MQPRKVWIWIATGVKSRAAGAYLQSPAAHGFVSKDGDTPRHVPGQSVISFVRAISMTYFNVGRNCLWLQFHSLVLAFKITLDISPAFDGSFARVCQFRREANQRSSE